MDCTNTQVIQHAHKVSEFGRLCKHPSNPACTKSFSLVDCTNTHVIQHAQKVSGLTVWWIMQTKVLVWWTAQTPM